MTVITHPLAPLVLLALTTTVALCTYAAVGRTPSAITEGMLAYGWGILVLLWMDADARKLRRLPCFDFGMLAAIFFPVSLVWYCFWSRGGRGLFVLLMLAALLLGPFIIAGAFFVTRFG